MFFGGWGECTPRPCRITVGLTKRNGRNVLGFQQEMNILGRIRSMPPDLYQQNQPQMMQQQHSPPRFASQGPRASHMGQGIHLVGPMTVSSTGDGSGRTAKLLGPLGPPPPHLQQASHQLPVPIAPKRSGGGTTVRTQFGSLQYARYCYFFPLQ